MVAWCGPACLLGSRVYRGPLLRGTWRSGQVGIPSVVYKEQGLARRVSNEKLSLQKDEPFRVREFWFPVLRLLVSPHSRYLSPGPRRGRRRRLPLQGVPYTRGSRAHRWGAIVI